ncbi:phosphonate C-P lyase system protein PhnH [Aquisalimonas lutea]|uniref:phosphonate C-P lyase system protein PhnH n=1 Tax=Aquisalimonas lutea TaxID=1327750 RepID=UPI0025B3CA15|nr:phosphonate C-P lyase system protein PhnH [Aquisalimonas lutea]MDN3516426.1 phosphonate C-P lyase system protein PhnH [Aquisalimonas lutea]
MATATTVFRDPVHDAQRTFRCALEAMARPATWQALPAAPEPLPGLGPGATALALTLLDHEVTAWLGPGARAAGPGLRFACGVAITEAPGQADFAFAAAAELGDLSAFAAGSDTTPETSATLVVEVDDHEGETGLLCSGPGLAAPTPLRCRGLPPAFAAQWRRQAGRLPCGVDVFLLAGRRLAALPRTVELQEAPCTQR